LAHQLRFLVYQIFRAISLSCVTENQWKNHL